MINKICPICRDQLESAIFHKIEVDYCEDCLGLWFEEGELREAKDSADTNLNWLDTDLWKDIKRFVISRDNKICPVCRLPLYQVNYGQSRIAVDLCNVCHGIWLDRGEFKKIMAYLKKEESFEVMNRFSEKILSEFWEIFAGPESIRSEISDFLTLAKILRYKFAAQNQDIVKAISELPK